MRVLFVGQNPSKDNVDFNVAFIGSRSHARLMSWIKSLKIDNYSLTNASRVIGPVTLKDADLNGIRATIEAYKPTHIVSLGEYASKVLKRMKIAHIPMPHPSGLNRKLNDAQFEARELERCREALK